MGVETLQDFLKERGAGWDGQPAELHKQLESDFKPPNANELSKRLEAIASRMPGLSVERGNRWVKEKKNQQRFIALKLENYKYVVNVVKGPQPQN